MEKEIIEACSQAFTQSLEALRRELMRIRTGRANPSMLDNVRVDYYGSSTPLAQMASVQIADARMMLVKPWDKSALSAIEKAINESDLGITPQNDGEMIRLPIPPLTEERRKEFVKVARARAEEGRIAARNARREANEMLKELQKEGALSEDDLERALTKVQSETDGAIAKVDEALTKKEKEIMEI